MLKCLPKPLFLLFFFFCILNLNGQENPDTLIANAIKKCSDLSSEKTFQLLDSIRNSSLFEDATCQSIGDLYFAFGEAHYNNFDDNNAILYWKDSTLNAYEKCLGKYHDLIAKTHFNIGISFKYLQELPSALKNMKKAINIYESNGTIAQDLLAHRYLEIGKLYQELKDYSQAITYLKQSEKNYLKNSIIQDREDLSDLYNVLGVCYHRIKRYNKAIAYYQKAIQIAKEEDEKDMLKQSLYNIAYSYLQTKDYGKANNYVRQIISSNEKDSKWNLLAENYNLLGVIKKRQQLYGEAINAFEKSINYAKRAYQKDFHPEIAQALENKADVLLLQKETKSALENYQKSILILVPDFYSTSFQDQPNINEHIINNKNNLQRVLDLKAQALQQYADETGESKWQEAALNCYFAVDTLSNQIRQGFQAAGSRYYFQEKIVPIYERAIALSLQLFEQTKDEKYLRQAYTFCAKNKALILLDGLQNEDAKFSANLPDSLLHRENQLKQKFAQLEAQIYDLEGSEEVEQLEKLRSELFQTRRNYEKLIDRFEQEFPAYFDLKYAFSAPIPLKDLQRQLPEKALILEYFIGEDHIYTFAIGKDAIQYYSKARPDNFKETCIQFRESTQLSKLDYQATYLQTAYQLYQWLLQAPLNESKLVGELDRLFIIPDDILLQISFDALLYEPTSQWKGKKNPYLLKKYTSSLAYANRLLFDHLKRDRVQASLDGFIGFGIEYDEFTLEGVSKLDNSADSIIQKRAVGKLPFSDDEVLEIAELIGGLPIVNEEATKEIFLAQANQHRIVHLAMHGIVNEEAPLQSGFIFTRTKDSIDYILRASDIYNMKLAADMAVLSACNTGYGRLEKGEGIRSLARAFSYAGCNSLVASLWEAPDNASKEILVAFYRNLKEGQTKDIALRNAKLNYIENSPKAYADPSFWAHLVTLGDVEALNLNTRGISYVWIVGLIIFVVLGFMGIKRLRPS